MDKRTFTVLLGALFVSMLGMNVISPFLPLFARKMGASALELGLVQAAFSVSGTFTLLFIGRLSDDFGRKPFLAGGLLLLALSSAALMFAASPVHLIVLRFFQGLGASAFLAIAQAYLGDRLRTGDEGRWMGYFNAVLFAGMGSGPLVGGVITDAFSLNMAFLALALMNTAAFVAVLVFLREMPRKKAVKEYSSLLSPLKSRILLGVFSYRLTMGIGTATLMAFVPLFAGLKLGLSSSLIGLMLAARIPISICQSYTGRMADTWNRRSMVIWGAWITVIAILLMPSAGGFWLLLIAYLWVTAGQALGIPAANAYVVQEGRLYGMGASVTMFMMAMYAGNSIGPVVLGGIADKFELESAFYAASFCMACGVAVFAFLVKAATDRAKLSAPDSK